MIELYALQIVLNINILHFIVQRNKLIGKGPRQSQPQKIATSTPVKNLRQSQSSGDVSEKQKDEPKNNSWLRFKGKLD